MKISNIINTCVDWFVIILEITYMTSIVYCILFDNIPFHPYILTIFTVLLCHFFRFGIKIRFFVIFRKSAIIPLFFFILLFDVIQNLLFFTSTMGIALLVNGFLFFNYLTNCYWESRLNLEYQLKPYVFYSLYNVITSLIILVLFFVGISYETNAVAYSVMNSNITKSNVIYYFPYYLAVASKYHSWIDVPVISGLSHEPHVIMYVVLPSFFFILGKVQNKYYKYIVYFLFFGMLAQTISTTAIVIFSSCIFIEAIWGYMVKKEKQILVFGTIVALTFTYLLYEYFNDASQLVFLKLNGEDQSGETSKAMLDYLFSGNNLIGTGHFPPEYGLALKGIGGGAGLIVGFLDLTLFFLFVFHSIRLIISKSVRYHYLGMGCLYYILHSLKLGYMIFWYPYMMFMIFILAIASIEYKTEKYSKNNNEKVNNKTIT